MLPSLTLFMCERVCLCVCKRKREHKWLDVRRALRVYILYMWFFFFTKSCLLIAVQKSNIIQHVPTLQATINTPRRTLRLLPLQHCTLEMATLKVLEWKREKYWKARESTERSPETKRPSVALKILELTFIQCVVLPEHNPKTKQKHNVNYASSAISGYRRKKKKKKTIEKKLTVNILQKNLEIIWNIQYLLLHITITLYSHYIQCMAQ